MLTKIFLSSVLLFSFLLIVIKGENVVIRDCGSVDGAIIKVDVSDCEDHDRCPLQRGTNVTVSASFKSNVTSDTLKAVVYGRMGIIKAKFNLPNPDACTSGVACPLKPDQTYNYSASIFIKNSYPALSVNIQLELRDDQGRDVICAIIPARIVSKHNVN